MLESLSKIPCKIHYVWMGGAPKSGMILKCIESWKKYCPGYEIIEWNEDNFDIHCCKYIEEAYNAKKWAFVADAVRVYLLKEYGGIYFDSDVELFNSPNDIFEDANAVFGFDDHFELSTGVLASVAHHPIYEMLWDKYNKSTFLGVEFEDTINTKLTFIVMDYIEKRRAINKNYKFKDIKIYSVDFFNGEGHDAKCTSPIFAVHHFSGSWKIKKQLTFLQYLFFKIERKVLRILSQFIGNKTYLKMDWYIEHKIRKQTVKNIANGARIYKTL